MHNMTPRVAGPDQSAGSAVPGAPPRAPGHPCREDSRGPFRSAPPSARVGALRSLPFLRLALPASSSSPPCRGQAFHRDIKGPNILLDKNGTAKAPCRGRRGRQFVSRAATASEGSRER